MDESHLDKKYFIDSSRYNCPFCKRGSVSYSISDYLSFDWTINKKAYVYIVKCASCENESSHFSYYNFLKSYKASFSYAPDDENGEEVVNYDSKDLDKYFFAHQPTSFFTINSLIPENIRLLVSEADGCRKMNFLVGASGALRKAIYEFIKDRKAEGEGYQEKLKWLKQKYPQVHQGYFDALSNIQDMTSENLHEKDGSWESWNSEETDYLIEVVKAILDEVYVKPKERQSVIDKISNLKGSRLFVKKDGEKIELQ